MRSCLPFVLLSVTMLLACEKDDTSPSSGSGGGGGSTTTTPVVTFTIDGDGFSDQSFTLNPITGSGQSLYSTADDETTGLLMTSTGAQFQVIFEGNTTGTQTCTSGTGPVGIGLTVNGQQYLNYTNTVTITEYGTVGGWVRGEWSGTLIRVNGASPGTIATVSNGTFRFKRMNDV